MTRFAKIQIALLLAGGVIAGWEFLQSLNQRGELAFITEQIQIQKQELASRRKAMEAAEERNRELEEAERRAGNQTLLSLMRERNAFTLATSKPAAQAADKSHAFGVALAKTLQSPEHRQANEDSQRAELRVGLYQLFKLLNLSPEKSEAYIDLNIHKERRQSDRLSALLQGKMTVDEAEQQRATDDAEHQRRCREVLGDEGMTFLNGIADGMRDTEAKRLLGIIQDNMGANQLNQDQGDRLQALLKAEVVSINMDDVELFRPPEEWTQGILERQQRILSEATTFLTPSQLDVLKSLAANDLAERQKQMTARRTALGLR
jgi:hypothetical protein